ncbi:MAG: LacI family DNA-binding transcriptional regulator [Actinomycetia bacterium]|nr:LacI family DNA-binding transcriptional regulator [Actinomycetes bacterium]
MKINIKTVAKKAGVSTATVSRVLADFKGMRENTRNKVLDVIKDLNYEVDSVARSLRQNKTYTIGIIVSNVLSQFYSIIAKSVEDKALKSGYKLILCNGDDDPFKELEYLKILKSNKVDGIILTPTGKNAEYINNIIKSGIQVVLLDRLVEGVKCDSVLVDNYNGSYTAVKYLLGRGYKRIAFIGGYIDRTTGRQRLDGYSKAIRDAGFKVINDLVKIGDFKKESGMKLTREILEESNRPDAIFAANIDMTLGCLIEIRKAGLSIPEDIAIVGFDDPDWSIIVEPPLTAISQPVYDLGSTAADLLIKNISSKGDNSDRKPFTITLSTDLIIRNSTR